MRNLSDDSGMSGTRTSNLQRTMKQSMEHLSIFHKEKKKQLGNFYDSLIPSSKCNDNCLRLRLVPTYMISNIISEHLIRKCYHPNRQCVISNTDPEKTQEYIRRKQSLRVAKRLLPALASTFSGVDDMSRNQLKLSILNHQMIIKLIDAVPAVHHVPTKFRPEHNIVPIKDLLCNNMLKAKKYCLDCNKKSNHSLSNYLDSLMKNNLRRRPPEFVEKFIKERPGLKTSNNYRELLRRMLTYELNPVCNALNLHEIRNQQSTFENPFLPKSVPETAALHLRKMSKM